MNRIINAGRCGKINNYKGDAAIAVKYGRKKKLHPAMAFLLVLAVLFYIPGGAMAVANVEKEENVYILLNNDGSLKNIYVVNAFDLETPGTIMDYGNYDLIRNISSTEELTVSNGQITANAPSGRFYYQGNLSKAELPWLVSISYYLDGKEISAQGLSGADGLMEIQISIRINPKAQGDFSRYYALQTSLTLDAELCKDIKAAGGAIANAGGNKMISFTMLPGNEADYKISAEVSDFHMDGMQINAMPLSMSISMPDTGVFTGRLSELSEGIAGLDNGMQGLNGGAADLKDGANKMNSGMKSMKKGMQQMTESLKALADRNPELVAGSSEILEGFTSILNGLDRFSTAASDLSEMTKGSANIRTGIEGLSLGLAGLKSSFKAYKDNLANNRLDAGKVLQSNAQMISFLSDQINVLKVKLSAETPGSDNHAALQTCIKTYEQMYQLLQGNNAVISADRDFMAQLETGVGSITDGSSVLCDNYIRFDTGIQAVPSMLNGLPQSIAQLKDALAALSGGYEKLHYGIKAYTEGTAEISKGCRSLNEGFSSLAMGSDSLYDGISEFYEGVQQLAKGTGQLRNETSSMDSEIERAIEEILETFTGGDFDTVSFVSPLNTGVKSVQFVMQTQGIEKIKQPVAVKKENVKSNLWKRLLALFGL